MKSYRIDRSKLNKYMARNSLKAGIFSSLGAFVFIGGITMWSAGISDFLKLIGPLVFISLVIGGIVFLTAFLKRSIPKATSYTLGSDFIGMKINTDELNAFNRFALNRSTRKHGLLLEQNIPLANVKSIEVKKSTLKITARDYKSLSSSAGRIEIPCEIENFQNLVNELKTLSQSFENISFVNS